LSCTLYAELLPRATLITPNLPEAAVLLGEQTVPGVDDMPEAAQRLLGCGCPNVLLKGGHLGGEYSRDLLVSANGSHWLEARRVVTRNDHGTGCTLSSAIAALLPVAPSLEAAVRAAKVYLTGCLDRADDLDVGRGHGPVHHFHELWPPEPAARLLQAVATGPKVPLS